MEQEMFYAYNQVIHILYECYLKEILIQSFIEFYGIEHQRKIKNVVDKLIIVRLNHSATDTLRRARVNQCQEAFKKVTFKLCKILNMSEETLLSLSDEKIQELVSRHLISQENITHLKRS